ncbi:FAD-dependent monooxygenase [Sphingobacterium haloxyli]|uniref:FAD-binding domain-containing protein n=1 Tax=Sphingobacterium haloxyli TaxID=2100533 RepID=A0A2S9J5H4_9SPHI|nr:FAD-dependent monooxygenase [Sphingobacterium haloxyli]PRD48046.1 hypothetical protein C5745_05905 [Sphingobacterium haloxyli]
MMANRMGNNFADTAGCLLVGKTKKYFKKSHEFETEKLLVDFLASHGKKVHDSAHVHSPAGAQGMNTGIQDAYNLAWKLAMVLKFGFPYGLLESYDEERRPIARNIIRLGSA